MSSDIEDESIVNTPPPTSNENENPSQQQQPQLPPANDNVNPPPSQLNPVQQTTQSQSNPKPNPNPGPSVTQVEVAEHKGPALGGVRFSDYLLAGKKIKPRSFMERADHFVENDWKEVKNSAKNTTLPFPKNFPWEMEQNANFLNSPEDIRDEEIKILLAQLNLQNVQNTFSSKKMDPPLGKFNSNNSEMELSFSMLLAQKLLAKKIDDTNADFKKNFIDWCYGFGQRDEYDECYWIPVEMRKKKLDKVELQQKTFQGTIEQKTFEIWSRKNIFETSRDASDSFFQGQQQYEIKKRRFLELLQGTIPKTQEEMWLFYKYIVSKKEFDPNYFYLQFDRKDFPAMQPPEYELPVYHKFVPELKEEMRNLPNYPGRLKLIKDIENYLKKNKK